MIEALVEQYEKHGWALKRVLLKSPEFRDPANELALKCPGLTISDSDIDALWFSRSRGTTETWELRRLSGAPFALLDVFDASVSDDERESSLRNVEKRMAESIAKTDREIPLKK